MSGEWVQTTDGRYVFDNQDGWFFDHLSQQWFLGDTPASTPTGAPAAATRKRFVSRLLQWPEDSIFWVGGHPRTIVQEGGFLGPILGMIVFLTSWAARGWIALTAGWVLLHLSDTLRGLRLLWITAGGNPQATRDLGVLTPGMEDQVSVAVMAMIYVAFAVFALIVLGIFSLNAEQSAALTTAFVAHKAYRHFVDDVGRAQVKAAEQYHRTHHGHGGGW